MAELNGRMRCIDKLFQETNCYRKRGTKKQVRNVIASVRKVPNC